MNYTLAIGVVTVLSAFIILLLTHQKEKTDEKKLADQRRQDSLRIAELNDTIVHLNRAALEQATEHTKQLAQKSDSISKEQAILIERQAETIELQKALQQETEKTGQLQERLKNEITGGNSFCYAVIKILHTANGLEEHVSICNDGDFPLRNVHIQMEKPKYAVHHLMTNKPIENWIAPVLNSSYSIGKHSKIPIYRGYLPDEISKANEFHYVFSFTLDNGEHYEQVYKFKKVNYVLVHATRIENSSNPSIHYEFVHSKYDENPVDWKAHRGQDQYNIRQ